jgi:hypothetical protein
MRVLEFVSSVIKKTQGLFRSNFDIFIIRTKVEHSETSFDNYFDTVQLVNRPH